VTHTTILSNNVTAKKIAWSAQALQDAVIYPDFC